VAKPRPSRVDWLARHIHPSVRFFWGLGLLACLVFAEGWQVRGLLAMLGMGLAVAAGKRVSPWYFGFLIATIVVFHLFLPFGKVWFQVGPWAVTDGAFFLGLGKGFTFSGLVFFSLASISRDLRLPGQFGALWGQTFSWYEQLMDQRRVIKPRALVMSIDRLLERLYPTRPGTAVATEAEEAPKSPPTTGKGWGLLVLTLVPSLVLSVLWR
jgi:hypothetical protein